MAWRQLAASSIRVDAYAGRRQDLEGILVDLLNLGLDSEP